MMDDGHSDRSLPPTEKRRREARQQGDVARSPELTASALLLVASLLLWAFAPAATAIVAGYVNKTLITVPQVNASSSLELATSNAGRTALMLLIPFFAALVGAGLAANWMQTGWMWSPAALVPRWRLQSLTKGERATELVISLVRTVALGVALWLYMRRQVPLILSLGQGEPSSMLVHSVRMLGELFIQLSTILLFVGLVDYVIRYWRREKRLMMTPEERRREQQEEEVDPRMKQRRSAA
ncbi:EscU/YscU/HrcU family type III secretion system export apparatus switch protein [Schlesneria sp.]|uniref:EscU/YscU/HrcU family type III secretion system export apparatus switch protein n=1 Tax=Schlesneria sp. TaxID=2762018 RepID=UPI002EDE543C